MKVYVSNGYDRLKSCLLCYPINYRITNKSNKFYNKVDYTLATNQYNKYINLFKPYKKAKWVYLVQSIT